MLKFGQDLRKTHKSTQRKNLRALQFSGIMQFELEFFLYIVHDIFYQTQLSTNTPYSSGVQKKDSLGSENTVSIPVHSLLAGKFGYRDVAQLERHQQRFL
jgi:hypothetical protein